MKNLFNKSITFVASLIVLFACESDNKFGIDESTKGFNLRMIADRGSFNIFDPNPEVNFKVYSESSNIQEVQVVVELFQFIQQATTKRAVVKTIPGNTLTNDGSMNVHFALTDFTTAVGVDPADLGGGDIFTVYNVVELTDGRVYPDTLSLDGKEFVNMVNTFGTSGLTTSYTAQLNFPLVCTVGSPFSGTYKVTDDCGLFAGTFQLTTVAGNPSQRQFTTDFSIPGCCSFDGIGFKLDLVCGRVFVTEQSVGLGCGGGSNVDVVTSDVEVLGPGGYDDTDDSEFTANIFYSNPDCFGGFDCTLTFTKQ